MLYELGLQFCSDADALPDSGPRDLYRRRAPDGGRLYRTLYLGGCRRRDLGALNITGTLVVRTDPNGTVTVGGSGIDALTVAAEGTTVAARPCRPCARAYARLHGHARSR